MQEGTGLGSSPVSDIFQTMELLFLCSPTNVSTLGLALIQVLGIHRDIMSPSMQKYILEAGKQANYNRCYREVHAKAKRKDAGEAGLGQVAVFTGSEWAWLTRSDSRSGLKKVRQLTYLSAESKL